MNKACNDSKASDLLFAILKIIPQHFCITILN